MHGRRKARDRTRAGGRETRTPRVPRPRPHAPIAGPRPSPLPLCGDEDPAGTRVPGPTPRSQTLVRALSHLPAALPGSEPESRAVSRDGFGARRSAASAPSLSLSDRPLSSSRGAEPTEVTAWGAWPPPAPSPATTVAFISSGFDGARCPPRGRARPTGRPRRPDVPKPSPPLTLREGPPPPARRAPRQS